MASSITLQRAAAMGLRIPTTTASPSSRQSLQSQTLLMRRLLLRPQTRTSRLQQSRPNSTKSTSSSPSTTTAQTPPSTTAATSTSTATAAAATETTAKATTRLDRILTRTSRYLPERLREPLRGFRKAPVSHVASFLILHELTAIIPLFGLTGAFYYLDILPVEWVFGWWAPYVQEEGTKVLRYFKKKGWFGLAAKNAGDENDLAKGEERLERELAEREEGGKKKGWFAFLKGGKSEEEEVAEAAAKAQSRSRARKAVSALKEKVTWDNSEMGYKLGVQIVAAYAITKMLLIPRVAFSLWLTPSFARAMVWSRKAIFRR